MPGTDGIETTRRILESPSAPKVIVLTTFDRNEYVYDALSAGASGVLLKDVRRGQLVEAIRTVVSGDTLISPSHVAGMLTKTGTRDRTQAVILAYESGLIRPGQGNN